MFWLGLFFLILSVIFFLNKGGFLISGYNTASKEVKECYDEKKLNQVMAYSCLAFSILFLVYPIFKDSLGTLFMKIFIILFFINVVLMLILTNTICKVKPLPQKSSKSYLRYLFIVPLVLFVFVALFFGNVKLDFKETSLTLSASFCKGYEVNYEDIDSVRLVDELNLGVRTFGIGSFAINAGHFNNKEFGDYSLYSYTSCPVYVILEVDDKIIVFNDKNEEKTRSHYAKIQEIIKNR